MVFWGGVRSIIIYRALLGEGQVKDKKGLLGTDFLLDNQYKVTFFIGADCGCEKYRVRRSDGKNCLLKIFDINKLDPERLYKNLPLEIYLMRILKHPSILSYIADDQFVFNGNKFLYLVTEFPVGNTVRNQLSESPLSTFYDIKSILRDVLLALKYLHTLERPVIFNNISDSSIIINQENNEFHAKLVDFSAARLFLQDSPSKILSSDFRYLPTETLQAHIVSKHTDLFGIGILLYQMTCGSLPWQMGNCLAQDLDSIFAHRKKSKFDFSDIGTQLVDYEKGIDSIIKKALTTDPNNYFNSAAEFLDTLEKGKAVDDPTTTYAAQKSNSPSKLASGKKGFEAVAGMSSLKQLIKRDILDILKNPEEYKKHQLGLPNGMILYGPPGCGKTFFAERLAEEAGYNFIKVVASDLASIYVHGTQQKIGQLFEQAREKAPVILFFDELDAMVPDRENDCQQSQRGEVNEFLSQLDNVGDSGVFVIGSTNKPDLIDKAILRAGRLEKHIYVPPPDFEARQELFRLYLGNRPIDLGMDYNKLAQLTEHYVSADIKFLIDEASRTVIGKKLARITMQILEDIVASIKPSITADMEHSYAAFAKKGKVTSRHIGFLND